MGIDISTLNLVPQRRDGQNSMILITSSGGGTGGGSGGGGSADLTNEIVARESGDASLSTALSYEVSTSVHVEGLPLNNEIGVFSGDTGDLEGSNKLTFDGSTLYISGATMTEDDIVSPSFVSGFVGEGFKIDLEDNGDYSATFDNLTIRKLMKVYELQINKISAVNGGLIISIANGKVIDISGTTTCWFDVNGGKSPIQFIADDWVRAQEWNNGVNYLQAQVDTVGSDYITLKNISGSIWSPMDLVQVGHPTNTARQAIIYITASDDHAPYIDFLDGVTNGSFVGKNIARIGMLDGISDASFGGALTGAGAYLTNIYAKGKIVISNPSDIDQTDLSNSASAGATVGATWGVDVGGSNLPDNNATVGATWNTNLLSIPAQFDTPGAAGLYMTGNYVGYWTGSAFASYFDKLGNFKFGNAAGTAGISWTQATSSLSIKGSITITNTIPNTSITGLGTLSTEDDVAYNALTGTKPPTDADKTSTNQDYAYGSLTGTKPPTDADKTSTNQNYTWAALTGIPDGLDTVSDSGLYMTSTYLGYYNSSSSSWTSYIDSSGNCAFQGVGSFSMAKVSDLGYYQGISIKGQDIYENFYNGDGGSIYINRLGYAGANTKARSLYVGDGKGNTVASFYTSSTTPYRQTIKYFEDLIPSNTAPAAFTVPSMTTSQRDYLSCGVGTMVFCTDAGTTGQIAIKLNNVSGGGWRYISTFGV